MTNKEFAKNDRLFLKCVELAKLEGRTVEGGTLSLKRQASKFRRGCGVAYRYKATAQRILLTEQEENDDGSTRRPNQAVQRGVEGL